MHQDQSTGYTIKRIKIAVLAQTASVLSPYIYAEDNWTDDMELASAEISLNAKQIYERSKNEV
jgi:hypothetical protein